MTKGDNNDLPGGICRALAGGTAGTANLVQPDGTERTTFPLLEGEDPSMVGLIKTGGTAADIWALY